MSRFHASDAVGQVVATSPPTSRVFEKYGIDYCCGGKISLSEACAKRGLEAGKVLGELDLAGMAAPSGPDLTRLGLSDLIEHILSTHHAFVKREIPRLTALMEKVVRVHGENHPQSLPTMGRIWAHAAPALMQHLAKEEEMLFPWIVQLDQGRLDPSMALSIDMPISVMEAEHDEHGEAFARLRSFAGDYVAPADACGSWRALWSGLEEFERDLHRHVHLENHVLFPQVRARAGLQPA